jgi:protein-tyrosine-phosphatase
MQVIESRHLPPLSCFLAENIMQRASTIARLVLLLATLFTPICVAAASMEQPPAAVLFVCEHGNVKSLIASTLFNQAAQKRGLPIRSTSGGLHPEPTVPDKIVGELRKEGVEVGHFKPQQVIQSDLSGAQRVIAIGVDLTEFKMDGTQRIEDWTDVPPASIDYAKSRAALLRHIDVLLTQLQSEGAK